MSEGFFGSSDRFLGQSVTMEIANEMQRVQENLNDLSRREPQEGFFRQTGILTEIPAYYLWGIQGSEEYSSDKIKRVEALLAAKGIDFLKAAPISSTLVPYNSDTYMVVICDGHHRARFAPKFGLTNIPSHVIPLSYLANHLSCKEDVLSDVLTGLACCAIGDIQAKRPAVATPHLMTGKEIERFGLHPLL